MEIRDTRNGEWHWVNNKILACSSIDSYDKNVYSALCTFSGYAEIRPSFETLAKRCNVSIRKAKNSIKKLEQVNFITVINHGKKGIANVYNLNKCINGCKKCTACTTKEVHDRSEEVHGTTGSSAQRAPHIDIYIDKDIDIAKQASPTPFILEEKLLDMEKNAGGYLDIIATFIREKKLCPENSKQLSNIISRYCKIAKKLEGAYTNKQVFDAIEKIKKDSESFSRKGDELDWTLETIYKKLTK